MGVPIRYQPARAVAMPRDGSMLPHPVPQIENAHLSKRRGNVESQRLNNRPSKGMTINESRATKRQIRHMAMCGPSSAKCSSAAMFGPISRHSAAQVTKRKIFAGRRRRRDSAEGERATALAACGCGAGT
mmetsp:Transcript_33272/g.84708  ORF Transcript_33272/g.84708 Transcript_33272/m.84708 type:complete len:130 (-) Transcript_33272:109-498(-)